MTEFPPTTQTQRNNAFAWLTAWQDGASVDEIALAEGFDPDEVRDAVNWAIKARVARDYSKPIKPKRRRRGA